MKLILLFTGKISIITLVHGDAVAVTLCCVKDCGAKNP